VREGERIVGGEEWQEKVDNREGGKKLLRTARNCHIVHVAVGWMDETESKQCILLVLLY
jgi:hypothetical protein